MGMEAHRRGSETRRKGLLEVAAAIELENLMFAAPRA
jgi:hypothetical protein